MIRYDDSRRIDFHMLLRLLSDSSACDFNAVGEGVVIEHDVYTFSIVYFVRIFDFCLDTSMKVAIIFELTFTSSSSICIQWVLMCCCCCCSRFLFASLALTLSNYIARTHICLNYFFIFRFIAAIKLPADRHCAGCVTVRATAVCSLSGW